MPRDTHKKIIKRLALAWLLLSLFVGSLVAYLEFKRIDAYVVTLAQRESTQFTAAAHHYFHTPAPDQQRVLEEAAHALARDCHFILVEFYTRDKEKILSYHPPQLEEIVMGLEEGDRAPLMGRQIRHEKYYRDGVLYLKLAMPITDEEDHQLIGWFQGIHQMAQQDLREILWRVALSILQVVVAIFLAILILYPVILALNRDLLRLSENLTKANIGMLKVVGSAVAKRDSDTNAHNYRVTIYAIRLGETIGLSRDEMRALIKGAFLHDVGKIAISDAILLKPVKLTPEEHLTMRAHVAHGVDIVRGYTWLHDAMDVVENHHEKYNGEGYLQGRLGTDIPLNARIFAIADVFDALSSRRPYKEPFSYEQSVEILRASAGIHLDPRLVEIFLTIAPELYALLSGNDQDEVLDDLLNQSLEKYFAL